jgi:hypothetical protein
VVCEVCRVCEIVAVTFCPAVVLLLLRVDLIYSYLLCSSQAAPTDRLTAQPLKSPGKATERSS